MNFEFMRVLMCTTFNIKIEKKGKLLSSGCDCVGEKSWFIKRYGRRVIHCPKTAYFHYWHVFNLKFFARETRSFAPPAIENSNNRMLNFFILVFKILLFVVLLPLIGVNGQMSRFEVSCETKIKTTPPEYKVYKWEKKTK